MGLFIPHAELLALDVSSLFEEAEELELEPPMTTRGPNLLSCSFMSPGKGRAAPRAARTRMVRNFIFGYGDNCEGVDAKYYLQEKE